MQDDAVSPVVGTILLVAITLVLTAAAWAVITSGDKEAFDPPHIGFVQDSSGVGGTITVASINDNGGKADWARVSFGPATVASCTLPTGEIHAGDVVECSTEGHVALIYAMEAGETFILYETDLR